MVHLLIFKNEDINDLF